MCGRYASFREAQALADAFDVEEITDAARELPASYNVAPTEQVRIVVDRVPKAQRPHTSSTSSPGADTTGAGSSGADTTGGGSPVTGSSGPSTSGDTPAGPAAAGATAAPAAPAATARRELHLARWGLVPPWARDLSIGARMFNAREDSLATKRSFAPSLRARRCVVVADGYYEWLKEEVPGQAKPHRTPFYIHRTDSAPLAFAGLYSWWPDPDRPNGDPQRWVLSTTIVTTQATGGLEKIHHREPVVLGDDATGAWLDPSITASDDALAVLTEPGPAMSWYEVSSRVGSVRNNDASLIDPV
ncbi:MAG TPA: SOS response-associated peptidase [Ruania sp.]|nr:SOS response-associated peptidase [Ruania sp.]